MTTTLTIDNKPLLGLRVIVANIGPWVAECDLQTDDAIADRVQIRAGNLTLTGTVQANGVFGMRRRVRVVAGAGGWASELPRKNYHNDAGVKAQLIAEDAARESGETLGTFLPSADRIGRDYVRAVGQAARAVEFAAGPGVAWWVDYAGVTHAGPRPLTPVVRDRVQALSYDPRSHLAVLAADDPTDVVIGADLSPLHLPYAVRELQIEYTPSSARMTAWLNAVATGPGRLAGLMRAVVDRVTDARLWGHYRFRVVKMAADGRVSLQAIKPTADLPDTATVSQWPGVAGTHAELSPGAEVILAFIDGDPAQPIITHYAGKDGRGFVPESLVIGGTDGKPAARQGDAVEVSLPPATLTGTYNGAPITGVIQFLLPKTSGIITAGSNKVKVGPP